jgi:opacity protein-like surface antigen
MNRRTLIFAMSVLTLPVAAQAQVSSGAYLSVGAGINKMQEEDVDAHLTASPTSDVPGELLTSIGPSLVFAIGRGFHKNLRAEVEGNYLSNKIKGESGLAGEDFGTGTERKYGVMANGLYEFNGSWINPYLGGGLGVQFISEPDATSSSGGVLVSVTGATKSAFAYQFIGGAEFPVHSKHGLSITAEYRYLALTGTRTYKGTATVPGVGSFDLSNTSSNDKNHSFLAGIRYAFGG